MANDKLVYDGFNKVWQVEVEVKGEKRIYEKVDIKSAVAGILIDEEGKIALVTQYRPIIGIKTREIPAGMIDKNLTNRDILIEEFAEECDIEKDEIIYLSEKPIISYYMLAGSSDCTMNIYEGRVTNQVTKEVSDGDVEKVEWITLKEFGEIVDKGQIYDNKTLLAYYYLKARGCK